MKLGTGLIIGGVFLLLLDLFVGLPPSLPVEARFVVHIIIFVASAALIVLGVRMHRRAKRLIRETEETK